MKCNELRKRLGEDKCLALICYGKTVADAEGNIHATDSGVVHIIAIVTGQQQEEHTFDCAGEIADVQCLSVTYCHQQIAQERSPRWVQIFRQGTVLFEVPAGPYFTASVLAHGEQGLGAFMITCAKDVFIEGPRRLTEREIEKLRQQHSILLASLKSQVKRNADSALLMLNDAGVKLINTYFRLQRNWAQGTRQQYLLFELAKADPNLHRQALSFLQETDVRNKYYHFYKMTEAIFRGYGGISSETKTIRLPWRSRRWALLLQPWQFLSSFFQNLVEQQPRLGYHLPELARIMVFLRPYRWYFIETALFTLFITGLALIPAYFSKLLIDTVLPASNYGLLKVLLLGGAVLMVVKTVLEMLQGMYATYTQHKLEYETRFDFFYAIFRLPYRFFTEQETGAILYRFSDLSAALQTTSSLIIQFLTYGIQLLIIPVVIIIIDLKLALLSLLIVPLDSYLYYKMSSSIRRYVKSITRQSEEYSAKSYESISAVRAIRTFGITERTIRRLRHMYLRLRLSQVNMSFITSFFAAATAIGATCSTLVVIWYAWHCILAGEMTFGEFTMFGILVGYLLSPIKGILEAGPEIQRALVRARRFLAIYELPKEDQVANGILIEKIDRIVFNNVSFCYQAEVPILDNFSCTFDRGEMVAIVGASGAGKSTILSLVARLYEPQNGTLMVNGCDLRTVTRKCWHQRAAVVFHDDALFEGSLRDNIKMVRWDITDSEMNNLLQLVDWQGPKIHKMFDLEIALGEGGVKLSAGEKARLLLARALAREPRLLALDELLATIEFSREEKILRQIRRRYPELLIILTAHREQTLRLCDKIILLEKGIAMFTGSYIEFKGHPAYTKMFIE